MKHLSPLRTLALLATGFSLLQAVGYGTLLVMVMISQARPCTDIQDSICGGISRSDVLIYSGIELILAAFAVVAFLVMNRADELFAKNPKKLNKPAWIALALPFIPIALYAGLSILWNTVGLSL